MYVCMYVMGYLYISLYVCMYHLSYLTTNEHTGKEDLELVNQIVAKELIQIEEEYVIDLWTLNVIHYLTAISVSELNGNVREEKKNRKPHGKPGWQIRLESRIDATRRKLSHINVIAECKKIKKYAKHQKNSKARLKKTVWKHDEG